MSPTPSRSRRSAQAGEGKIGCILSLLVLAAAGALAVKLVPVFYSDNALASFADDLTAQAGVTPAEALSRELTNKAKDLDIPEALAEGALSLSTSGEGRNGICTIKIKYARTVDLYGLYPLTISTDKTITKPYMDNR